MTGAVERFSVESLLLPDVGARVMQPALRIIDVHWHDYYELSLVLSGRAEHVVNGTRGEIGPGSAFLLCPADFHEIRALGSEPLVCFNTVVEATLMERQLESLGMTALDEFPWHTDDFAAAEPDLRRLQRELERPGLGSAAMTEGLVACVVTELARRCGVEDRGDRRATGDDGLRRALLHVDRHFREPISLAEAAAQAHLSPNYFSERFRVHTGTSFQLYLQSRRLRFARSLLAATSLSVSEVCHAAGFGTLSHFGRAYRRRFGVAPSEGRHVSAPSRM